MFEISSDDIISLSDVDLRSLVKSLAVAELRKKGCPISSITAGGNQDAADGGLDVRVECFKSIADPDFVPRQLTGFQVKKPDMPESAIREEMCPKGVLRDVIRELAEVSGAYIIVSAQGSVADKSLTKRREAIRKAVGELPNARNLHTDFYDRDRLATWANEYPGVAAWVRGRVGRPLAGWSGIGDWEGSGDSEPKPYLFNDDACLVDECSRDREHLTISAGVARLRASLNTPKQCVRLVGLSGLGKTRLVQALFEESVGESSLDPSLAVYTDYSEETDPTARDMARGLVARGQRAILIVDNCNPSTHSEVARLCSGSSSKVSLLTVEYDVQEDEPERTKVFRLQSSSPELITEWLKQCFPEISQIDRKKIADFSDGNFRVARALAETLGRGETLGSLKSRELFERIFQQRNAPNLQLLHAAEDLSLLYSVEGEDVSVKGELARMGSIRDIDSRQLYEALVEMRKRGVVQARGRFRAILPHAIANPLASHALDRIPPADFDAFCGTLTPRMLKSVSRRVGFLHDSMVAKAAVIRWLGTDGFLGDLIGMGELGLQIVSNIAPVAPEAVLEKMGQELLGPNGHQILSPHSQSRHQWIQLIKALGYDAHLFDSAVLLLASFRAAEPEGHNYNSGQSAFCEIFHLYLSGTRALPEQRRAAIKRLSKSEQPALRICASIALSALLNSNDFTSMNHFDFGARSRDWGWSPTFNQDIWDWYDEAIKLAVELAMHLADARILLANHVRSLWNYGACDALSNAAIALSQEQPWIEGWIAFRTTLRYEGEDMVEDVRAKLVQTIDRLKPIDLLNRARAIVINRANGGWDFADGEDDDGDATQSWNKASELALEVGKLLANDDLARRQFFSELLVAPHAPGAFVCGQGLADGADQLDTMWHELVASYEGADLNTRKITVLSGFLYQAHRSDGSFSGAALEAAIKNTDLAPDLPYLQAQIGVDDDGISRLRRAIASGVLVASNFGSIANNYVSNSPPESFADLLEDLATLPDGVEMALNILSMHFYREPDEGRERNSRLIAIGRELLTLIDFSTRGSLHDFSTGKVIGICLVGEEGRNAAERICANIRSTFENIYISSRELNYILKGLFEAQPYVALDTFLLPGQPVNSRLLFGAHMERKTPVEEIDSGILQGWANRDPERRYPLLGECLNMFDNKNNEEGSDISSLFLTILSQAPDARLFLGDFWKRLHPGGWTGSLADILIRRKSQVMKLAENADEDLRDWVVEIMPELDGLIEEARARDRGREESFE